MRAVNGLDWGVCFQPRRHCPSAVLAGLLPTLRTVPLSARDRIFYGLSSANRVLAACHFLFFFHCGTSSIRPITVKSSRNGSNSCTTRSKPSGFSAISKPIPKSAGIPCLFHRGALLGWIFCVGNVTSQGLVADNNRCNLNLGWILVILLRPFQISSCAVKAIENFKASRTFRRQKNQLRFISRRERSNFIVFEIHLVGNVAQCDRLRLGLHDGVLLAMSR